MTEDEPEFELASRNAGDIGDPKYASPSTTDEVLALLDKVWTEDYGDLRDGQVYFRMPDSADAIAESIWQRIDVDAINDTVDAMNRNFALVNGDAAHVGLEAVASLSAEERDTLARTAGSAVLREAVDLLSELDQASTVSGEQGLLQAAIGTPSESAET